MIVRGKNPVCFRKAQNIKDVALKCIKYKVNTCISERCLTFPSIDSHLRMERKALVRFAALP